jgi:chromosome segregation ATPase
MNLSKTQNNKLQSSVNDLTIRIESLQRNLATSLEKEAVAVREARLLNEQLKNGDKGKVELHNQLLAVMKQKDNKHTQLCETIALNHKLGAQVRFLASQVFAECHHGLGLTNYNEEIKNIEMQVNTNINNDNTEYDDNSIYSDSIIATKTIEELIVDIKALRTKADVLQSSYLASRAELQIALRQQTFAEERTVEQQNMIDSLQSRLSNIQNEKETASGNADSLRKQITETNSELNRYKLLLAVAERKVVEKDSELSELKDDITALKDNLSVSECAKKDLISLCAGIIYHY